MAFRGGDGVRYAPPPPRCREGQSKIVRGVASEKKASATPVSHGICLPCKYSLNQSNHSFHMHFDLRS